VRRELFDGEVANRLAQRFVLVGEDEVLARVPVIGLEQALGGGGYFGGSPRVWGYSGAAVVRATAGLGGAQSAHHAG
jgi:hypothetical protein